MQVAKRPSCLSVAICRTKLWQRSGHGSQYYEVVAQLVAAGAQVTPDITEWDKARLDPDMLAALRARPQTA